MMNNKKPIVGITMGDPASIGPEIAVKSMNNKVVHNICNPVIVGDSNIIKKYIHELKLNLSVNNITNINEANFNEKIVNVYDLKNVGIDKLEIGKVSAMAGRAAFESVKKVIDLALSKEIDATVTGPINKEAINLAGFKFSGHTEIYAHFTKTKKYAMLLVEENFRVIHVSTHVSLRKACDLVKKERIIEVAELLNDACKMFGISNPKIAIAGLNPHSSDGGLFGNEEQKEIIPAVQELINNGLNVVGPYPSDTLFSIASGGAFDGCVAMYHDQGHIPFKMEGFKWDKESNKMKSVTGVNITLGLPIIRTSVDHGTALEIAGRGIASEDALLLAIKYAVQIYGYRNIIGEN